MEQSNVEATNYSGVCLYRYNKVIYYGIGDECRYDTLRYVYPVRRKERVNVGTSRMQYW